MNDQDIIDTIADRLAPLVGVRAEGCAKAVLAVLRERYAIVELPEAPYSVLIGGEPEDVYIRNDAHGDTAITVSGAFTAYVDEARDIAAALLAAADAAEADQ